MDTLNQRVRWTQSAFDWIIGIWTLIGPKIVCVAKLVAVLSRAARLVFSRQGLPFHDILNLRKTRIRHIKSLGNIFNFQKPFIILMFEIPKLNCHMILFTEREIVCYTFGRFLTKSRLFLHQVLQYFGVGVRSSQYKATLTTACFSLFNQFCSFVVRTYSASDLQNVNKC